MSARLAALEAGALIRAVVGPELFGEGAPPGAWTERARGADRVWSRRPTGEPGWFLSEGLLPGPSRQVAALIKEADLGGLAGSLRRWRAWRADPTTELISYTSRLPWPLADRHFSVLERYGGGPDEALLLGQDTRWASLADIPEPLLRAFMAELPEAGTVGGSVLCSAYRLTPRPNGCRLRRLTRIELHLPLPAAWTTALLARTFLDDLDRLRTGLARPPEGLEARIEADPIYGVW